MIVSFALKNQIIRRTDYNIVVAQSKNYLRARFDALSDDWTGPITAIFNEYTVLLDGNNECLVPWEVLQNPGVVKVSAFCGDLHTASVATMVVKPSGYTEGETPEPPTPGVYAQLTGLVQNAVDTANSVQQRADAGEFNGKDGTDGKDGANGQDGYSPIADVQQTTGGATITITDKTGTTTANIYNGRDGVNGENGADGVSPIATVEQADDGVVITITDKSGTTTATAHNGRDGTDGVDGRNAPQIDDTQASLTNPWSGAKTESELSKKLDSNQGADNAGKVLGIIYDGSVAPVDASSGIDDTTITTENPWSSKKIVDTVCPPFEVTGPIVTCNPMAGTPLHVVSQIVALQEGDGDPSPDNVRPITGWTEANLWHGGKNLISGLKKGYYGTDFKLYEPNSTVYVSFSEQMPAGKYAISYSKNVNLVRYFTAKNNKTATTSILETDPINTKLAIINLKENDILYISFRLYSNDPWDATAQMEYGTQTSPYEPYKGQVVTLGFGQTVYGGTLDWNTGVLTIDHFGRTYTHLDSFYSYSSNGVFSFATNLLDFKGKLNPITTKWMCDTLIPESYNYTDANKKNYSVGTDSGSNALYFRLDNNQEATVEDFKTWIGQHPTTVVADLRTPFSIQLTPTEILALSGVNTLYTDTGDTTVSGLADPISIINKLAERIAALESAATNI